MFTQIAISNVNIPRGSYFIKEDKNALVFVRCLWHMTHTYTLFHDNSFMYVLRFYLSVSVLDIYDIITSGRDP